MTNELEMIRIKIKLFLKKIGFDRNRGFINLTYLKHVQLPPTCLVTNHIQSPQIC